MMPTMIFMTRYYNSSQNTRRLISVSNNPFKISHLTLFAMMVFFVSSCAEIETKIGNKLLPESDFVNIKSIDTLSAFSYTFYDESTRTDNPSVSYLGQIYDPYFGTSTAEFVSQIRLSEKWNGQPFTIDSVRLHLRLLTVTGGSDAAHTLRISEIADQIYPDSAYYPNKPVSLTGYALPDIQLPSNLRTDTLNDVVLKLPIEFGNYLTRDTTQLFYSNTKPDFRSFFKGLYFQILPSSDPQLVSLSLLPSSILGTYYNYVVLYMHDDTGTATSFFFVLDAQNKNAAYNRYIHDYNTASPDKKIKHINDGYKDTLSYLQSLFGVYTRVILPGLEKIKNDSSFDKISVNKARLTVPVYFDGNQFKPSTVPPQLILRYRTKSGNKHVVPDWNIEPTNQTFFNGKIDSVANVYSFNIPAFVRAYFKDAADTIEPELEIFQGTGIKNVILKANKSKTPVKFEFSYTKF